MRRIVLCLLIGMALVGGCAEPGARPAGDGAARPAVSAAAGVWPEFQADVTAVRRSADPKSVVLTVSMMAGDGPCSQNPHVGYYTEENDMIYANVVQESLQEQKAGVCTERTPGTVTLSSKTAIGDRVLVLNQQAWQRDGDTYRLCSSSVGCNPPADHCDNVWVQAAVEYMDVSRHSTGRKEACADPWLVMTVPDDPAACGAEPRDGCTANTTTRRYFLHFASTGWQIEARSTAAGCDNAPAGFPRKMCAGLPAPF